MSYPHDEYPVELRPLPDQQPSAATVPLMKDMAESSTSPRRLSNQPGPLSNQYTSRLVKYVPESRRARRLVYILLGIAVILFWIGMILAFARFESKSERTNLEGDAQKYRGRGNSSEDEIWLLQGALRKLNSEDRTLTVQWSAAQYFANNNSQIPLILSQDDYPAGVNMYRDIQAVIDETLTNDSVYNPNGYIFYQLDNATAYPIGNVGLREWDSFDTDIDLTDVEGASVWRQPMRGYPFDQWTGSIVIASCSLLKYLYQNNVWYSIAEFNDTQHYALSFDGISLDDSLLNWRIHATSDCTCRNDDNYEHCDLHIDFSVRRPTIVKFTVIAVVIVNWLSTLVIFFLTGETLLLRRMRIVNSTDILSVLFAALFALPGVRSLLPDAPPFGCTIDLVGILPNVIIISLCTFCWACMKMNGQFNGENDTKVQETPSERDAVLKLSEAPSAHAPWALSSLTTATMGPAYSDPFDIELKGRYDDTKSVAEVPLMGESKQSPRPTRPPITVVPRRMSRDWFSYMYRRRRLWPRILYVFIGVSIMLMWIGLILGFAHSQLKAEEKNSKGDSKKYEGKVAKGDEVWFLQGALRALDTDKRTLTVQWSGFVYNDTTDSMDPLLVSPDDYPAGLNMYRDIQAYVDSDLTNDTGYYYFMLDNATANPIGNIGWRESDSFDTDIDLVASAQSVWTQPMRGYPYDQWTGSLILASNNIGSSMEDNRTDAYAFSFDGVYLVDSLLTSNWKITAASHTTCRDLDSAYCELHVDFRVRRPGLVKFTVIAVLVVNWLSTIVIFLLTGEALLLRRLHIVEGTDMLGVLFAALFALPGVRSLLPGAPPFGSTIDLVGILPNVIIISLCTSCWAVAKLSWKIYDLYDEHVRRKERELSMSDA
ncbi:uncharacterized protein SCHCODRAFT_02601887 [Schizophyllum commune H4-8]|uniref:Uncharacterized protein n=1 Tax=Schizophyllum commune (strain H4-8 / FGSC 9210) TaxID=578458 RepID=D8QEF3_SCHCM|nr:uncharacterized protein SCHCODRAFT_02601887 [Schizophyllum commune H4-8]KAI5888308.1 hypothetical protein SCHCODRAFT_02601887 [Schizophyllum commune H4-8]